MGHNSGPGLVRGEEQEPSTFPGLHPLTHQQEAQRGGGGAVPLQDAG